VRCNYRDEMSQIGVELELENIRMERSEAGAGEVGKLFQIPSRLFYATIKDIWR
jgi:hypothetical protein